MSTPPVDHGALPYRIAVLCYLYDEQGRVLLLHRLKNPNAGMYSPVGGKLEVGTGEGPHDCAVREIHEETGLAFDASEVRLIGLVTETAYEDATHWLMFLFEVTRPIAPDAIVAMEMDEGTLEWIDPDDVAELVIPETDRTVMWPNVRAHRGGFFAAHIDCRTNPMTSVVHESWPSER